MNKLFVFMFLIFLSFSGFTQETKETGFSGDHFSLQAALEMFKKADNPEAFERLINNPDNYVTNLDLNEDGETDYLRVVNVVDGDLHVFIIQAVISEDENQDIAVIEIEKLENGEVILQIIGDEEIFGEEIIVEAAEENNRLSEMSSEDSETYDYDNLEAPNPVNVYSWPSVRYIYRPSYIVWHSPYRWRTYPIWYKPWRPLSWKIYYPFRTRHYHGIRVVHKHRVVGAHKVYTPHRTSSKIVKTRKVNRSGNTKVQRTKTKVTGPRGNSTTIKSTKVTGKNGKVKAKRTTATKRKKGN